MITPNSKLFIRPRRSPEFKAMLRSAMGQCVRPRLEELAVEAANDAYRDVVVTD